jgi:hypothetical protein
MIIVILNYASPIYPICIFYFIKEFAIMIVAEKQDVGFQHILSKFKNNLTESEKLDIEFTDLSEVYRALDGI